MLENIKVVPKDNGYQLMIPKGNLLATALGLGGESTKSSTVIACPDGKDAANWGNSDVGGSSDIYKYHAPKNARAAIISSRQYFYKDPLVRRIIELMAQLTTTHIRLTGPQKNKDLFKRWMSQLNIATTVAKWIALEYFLSANAFVLRQTAKFKDTFLKKIVKGDFRFDDYKLDVSALAEMSSSDIKATLLAVAEAKEKKKDILGAYSQAAQKMHWTKKTIPVGYTILNAEQIQITGVPEFNLTRLFYTPPAELIGILKEVQEGKLNRFSSVVKTLPLYLLSQVAAGPVTNMKATHIKLRVELLPEDVVHIARMKRPFDGMAYPLLMNAFEALERKERMIAMDRKLIDHVIRKILLIKVGNDEYPAKPRHIKAINNMMKQQGSVWKLVWNHAIDVKWVEVDTEALVNKEKYDPLNTEIRSAFGMNPLFTGEGIKGTEGAGMISMRGLIENITDAQQEIERWTKKEFEFMGESLHLDSVPIPKCNIFHLEDKVSLNKIYATLVDRGILTNKLVAELQGEDWDDDILPQIRRENKLRENSTLPGMGSPYQVGGGSGEKVTPGGGTTGKPIDSVTDYPSDRDKKTNKTAVRAAASTYEVLGKQPSEEELVNTAMEAINVLEKRFSKERKKDPFECAIRILGGIPSYIIQKYDLRTLSEQALHDLSSAKLERCIAQVKKQQMKEWKKQHPGEKPSKEDIKKMTSSAWAICRTSVGE